MTRYAVPAEAWRPPELKALAEVANLGTVLAVDLTDDYQGSAAAVVQDNRYYEHVLNDWQKIGVAIIGYGSCGGCDNWQGSDHDPVERLEYLLRVVKDIKWFRNLADMQAYVAGIPLDGDRYSYNSDHDLQWYGHEKNFPKFQQLVAALEDGDELPVAVPE